MLLSSSNLSFSFDKSSKKKKAGISKLQITILGEKNVGKSAVAVRFITRRFIIDYEHGVNKRYKHKIMIDNDSIYFDILDTSFLDTLSLLDKIDDYFSEVDVLLLIYSITDRKSFNYIRTLLRYIAQFKSNNTNTKIPLIAIVGNKNDLIHLRQVSREEGEILCHENSELTSIYLGEFNAAEMPLQDMFIDLFKWVKRQKSSLNESHGHYFFT